MLPAAINPPNNGAPRHFGDIASAALRYTALSTVAVASAYFVGMGFLGGLGALTSSFGILFGAGRYTLKSIQAIQNLEIPADQIANKADRTARVILWSLMTVGAIAFGFSAGYCFTAASLCYRGLQAGNGLLAMHGAFDLTFGLGFMVPSTQFLLRNSNFLYDGYNRLTTALETSIAQGQMNAAQVGANIFNRIQQISQRVGAVFLEQTDFNTLLEFSDYLSEESFHRQFLTHLPQLTNQQISAAMDRAPTLLTIQFLAQNLSEDQFNQLVAPKLASPMTAAQLQTMTDSIRELENNLATLENERNDPSILQRAESLSATLSSSTRQILEMQKFIRRLPAENLPEQYNHLQAEINAAREMTNPINELATNLLQTDNNSLRIRLQRLQSLHAQPAADDSEDPNYEVLGAYGFTLRTFRDLGRRLGVHTGNEEIQRTCEQLDQYGLNNRAALIRHHILVTRNDGAPLDPDTIAERIIAFCTPGAHPQPANPHPVAPQRVAPQPQWATVSRIVNRIFHITLTTSLMALEWYYLPVSTTVGFVSRMLNNTPSGAAAELSQFFQPTPDYIHQGFSERMRSLYWGIWGTVWTLRFGPVGGFVSGAVHGNAVNFYIRQWRNRVQRLPA